MSPTSDLHLALEYLDKHFDGFVETLKDLVRIPSISFDGFPHETIEQSAETISKLLEKSGFQEIEILKLPDAHPYVYAEYIVNPELPTILLYAHHDVQPPMREDLWESPPFEPTLKKDRLYGRGAADDKAGCIVHLASILCYLKTCNELPINIKLIIEGEEEIGSPHLKEFLTKYQDKLSADLMILTDLQNFDVGVPSLTTSLRGLVALEVEVSSIESPLHSGMWGGPIPDPAMGLSRILSSLSTEEGQINIPELYEDIIPLTDREKESHELLNLKESEFRKQTGMLKETSLIGGKESITEKMWRLPSLSINSIVAGDRVQAGNVILSSAWSRISIRLVPGMDPEKVEQLLIEHLNSKCPWGLELKIKKESSAGAWRTETDHPVFELALEALSEGYDSKAVLIGCGGTIPFAGPMTEVLGGIPALLVGIEDPYSKAHSENESLHLPDFKNAIKSQIILFDKLGKMGKSWLIAQSS